MTNQTYRMAVDPNLIHKSTAFFNATTIEIIEELLQNARRAGATRVDINLQGDVLTIEDNGCGLFSKGFQINLGGSNWDAATRLQETPAGCGLFSLANKERVEIEANGYRTVLTPKTFTGQEDYVAEELPGSVQRAGTRITVYGCEKQWYFKSEVQDRVKHLDMTVFVGNEQLTTRQDFIPDQEESPDHFVAEWNGLRFSPANSYCNGKINFYGMTCPYHGSQFLPYDAKDLQPPRPHDDAISLHWMLIDVVNCPELQLVLPRRRDVVQNDFWKELQQYISDYCAQHLAKYDSRLLYETSTYERLIEKGYNVTKKAYGYETDLEYQDGNFKVHSYTASTPIQPDDILIDTEFAVENLALLQHALEYNKLSRRIVVIRTNYAVEVPEGQIVANRLGVDKEGMTITLYRLEVDEENTSVTVGGLMLPTDIVWAEQQEGENDIDWLEAKDITLSPDHKFSQPLLASFLFDAWFRHYDDGCFEEVDSYETQVERARDKAEALAKKLIPDSLEDKLLALQVEANKLGLPPGEYKIVIE